MMNVLNAIMVIVGIILTIIGIDYLIKVFFKELFNYQKKTNDDAINQFSKVFDKIPDLAIGMFKKIREIDNEDIVRTKENFEKKDIDDWSIKD